VAGGGGAWRGDLAASDAWLGAVGLVGFLVLAVFFEVVDGLGGRPVGSAGRCGLAALLIGVGLSCWAVGCWRPDGREGM